MSDDSPAPAHKWPERVRELVVRWVGWSYDHYAIVLAATLALTAVAGIFAWKLLHNVETDFATLLPDKDRSVQDLRETRRRYGGTASVSILIASPDFSANAQFATALADRLLEIKESAGIRDVRYKEGPEREFLEKNKFLYADLKDLKTIHKRLKARIKWERCAKNPFCIQLDEKPEFTVDDIEEKYRRQIGEDAKRNRDGFLSNTDGTILALDVDVEAMSGRFGATKRLADRIRQEIADLDPESFHPGMEVGLWGSLIKGLYEYNLIIGEAIQTAGLSILLVFAVVFFYFRRFRPVLFMSLSVVVAILWTFALTWWRIGYLNQQTAFLGSIIVGNGINFSIIFMAR
ncbi:MAG: hypothetical protein AB1405_11690, partial [Bdellovibrionota bacterium]